jgi:hypothetical protein
MLYSVRSERLLMEEIDYSVLFRWFVGMNLDEPVWDVTVFTKNRDRLLDGDVAREFLCEVVRQAQEKKLTSDEHFTVDGTLVEAWASLKSFQPKNGKKTPPDDPGNPTVDFHGEKRSNQTHESTTDPDALLARKGRHTDVDPLDEASGIPEGLPGSTSRCVRTSNRASPTGDLCGGHHAAQAVDRARHAGLCPRPRGRLNLQSRGQGH